MRTATWHTTPVSIDPPPRDEALTEPNEASTTRWHVPVPAEDRGRTTIADRVFEAMAARIVGAEPGVGGSARRVLGVPVTAEDADRAPQVAVTVAGDVVSLRVWLSVTYPAPVHTMTDRVRRRLIDRIGALTGKQVGMVDIIVTALHHPDVGGRVVR